MSAALDRFELLRRLGHGTMAEVHLAIDGQTGREVALKRLLPHLRDDEELTGRFVEECRVMRALDHPCVVTFVDAPDDDGLPVLVLEYVPGPNLLALVNVARASGVVFSLETVARIGEQLLDALGYVHSATWPEGPPMQLVHRDVTPSNLLFAGDGTVKLVDFGVARATGRGTMTKTGAMVGKIGYLAPEIAAGSRGDPRSDLFSAGVILYELTTGTHPYPGKTVRALLDAISRGEAEDPRAHRPQLSQAEAAFLERAVATAPEKRFNNAWEMAAALLDAFPKPESGQLLGLLHLFSPELGEPEGKPDPGAVTAPDPETHDTVQMPAFGPETQTQPEQRPELGPDRLTMTGPVPADGLPGILGED
jgi:serine/threonine-protein kinase